MTININGGSTTTYFQGWDSFQNPTAYTVKYTTTTGTSTTTIKDASVTTATANNVQVNNTVYCSQTINSFVNNTPTICDTTTFPNVVTLTNGTGQVTLNTDNGALASTFSCYFATSYASTYLSGYTSGSLASAINTLIVGAINGRPTPLASFMNLYNPQYTVTSPNTNLYTKNIIDLTPYTENSTTTYGGASLISPRHVVTVAHAGSFIEGQQYTFTDKNGNAQTKTISSATTLYGDISIGYLDSAVTGITPYSVLPANATAKTKIPLASENTNAYGSMPLGIYGFVAKRRNPFGGGDYIRQMQLGVVTNISGSLSSQTYNGGAGVLTQASTISTVTSTSDVRYPYVNWFTNIIEGDSGSPIFLPTGLTTATGTPLTLLLGAQSSPGTSTSLSYYITEINSTMNAIKSGGDTTVYALDVISTSQSSWWNGFTTY